MTTHKTMPVAGYSDQTDENIELVNVNKRLEEKVLRQLDMLARFSDTDKGWLDVARTHTEQGFMAANRAIMKPGRLDGDL
jgi:hypothetical protein